MVHRVEDTEFEPIKSIGVTQKVAALRDLDRRKVTFQNTGITTLTIGKGTSQKPLVAGDGWVLGPAGTVGGGDGGTIEFESKDRFTVISDAADGQMTRVGEF